MIEISSFYSLYTVYSILFDGIQIYGISYTSLTGPLRYSVKKSSIIVRSGEIAVPYPSPKQSASLGLKFKATRIVYIFKVVKSL